MKSSERCKATYQGDRCTRERDHENTSKDNPQVHLGEFTMWNNETVLFQRNGTHMRKRSRAANRAVRAISSLPTGSPDPLIREHIKKHLDNITNFFGGKRWIATATCKHSSR